jgi:FkbM family methyltransferase
MMAEFKPEFCGIAPPHELELIDMVMQCGAGRTFVDVGVNEGLWAIPLSSYYKHVFGFEPNGKYHKGLIENMSRNSIINIGLLPVALGNIDDYGAYYSYAEVGGMGGLHKIANTGDVRSTQIVQVRTLDSYKFEGVDLIKVDTEGSELEVVQGALKTIKLNAPRIMLELHGQTEHGGVVGLFTKDGTRMMTLDEVAAPIIELLEPLGYKFERMGDGMRYMWCTQK